MAYLRDELDWPIENRDFEDLTFEYSPREIGLDPATSAKILSMKRLRPLTASQPWGIFFVEFEPRRLPVLALRRILNRVVHKKRHTGINSDSVTWGMDELLFISSYGEGRDRQVSFANFSQGDGESSLPALRVLGWDRQDTGLHLDHVAESLHDHLTWPDDETDPASWVTEWTAAFTTRHLEVITSARLLAEQLAELAKTIRDRISSLLAIENDAGPTKMLLAEFKDVLIDDLSEEAFADMYAQTIAYGFLSARFAEGSNVNAAGGSVLTTPFLSELMGSLLRNPGADFDELGLSDLADLIDRTDLAAVAMDFGDGNRAEDPVIHFYELFLEIYDPDERKQQGVFYTPRPVVEYIVRSADDLLRSEFGLQDGLADTTTWGEISARSGVPIPSGVDSAAPFVQILDPATGTGTFLVETIDRIHDTMTRRWAAEGLRGSEIVGRWNAYVAENLLPRLHGFELMAAPYAIAHLRIGLKLAETGYRFDGDGRVHIYLTDTLAPSRDAEGTLDLGADSTISLERERADRIKDEQPITVIVGNPPYRERARGFGGVVERGDDGTGASPSLDAFKEPGAGRYEFKLHNLNVYFWRWATWKAIQSSGGFGVTAFITTSAFMGSPAFQGMRRWVRRSCTAAFIVDCTPEGHQPDVPTRLFAGVQQPLAIMTLCAGPDVDKSPQAVTRYRAVHGLQRQKFDQLSTISVIGDDWSACGEGGTAPFLASGGSIWESSPLLSDLMPENFQGVKPNRSWTNAPHESVLLARWDVLKQARPDDRQHLFKETRDRKLVKKVKPLSGFPDRKPLDVDQGGCLPPVLVAWRSFDVQWIIPDSRILDRARPALWKVRSEKQVYVIELHSEPLRKGPGLVFSAEIPASSYLKGSGGGRTFPIWMDRPSTRPNIRPGFLERWGKMVGDSLGMLDWVEYLAGVTGFATYQRYFAEELKTPGIRVPLSTDRQIVERAKELGRVALAANTRRARGSLANLESLLGSVAKASVLLNPISLAPIDMPEMMSYDEMTGTLSIGTGRIGPVRPEVIDFTTSGMNVLRKWFGYRKKSPAGRTSEGLNAIVATHWYQEWTDDLLCLLEDLSIMVACEPLHAILLTDLLDGPMMTTDDLG